MADTWMDVLTEEQRSALAETRRRARSRCPLPDYQGARNAALDALPILDALGAEIERLREENLAIEAERKALNDGWGRCQEHSEKWLMERVSLQNEVDALRTERDALAIEATDAIAVAKGNWERALMRYSQMGGDSAGSMFADAELRQWIIAQFVVWFSESGAENYIEMALETATYGSMILTLQRHSGKTPHALRMEAEAQLTMERANVAALSTANEQLHATIERLQEEPERLRTRMGQVREIVETAPEIVIYTPPVTHRRLLDLLTPDA